MSGLGFSLRLLEKLWQQRVWQPGDDPVLLAKVVTDEGTAVYPIDIHLDGYRGFNVTVFDPDFPLGYRILSLAYLERTAKLCTLFEPQRLSTLSPDWLDDDEQYC